MYVSVQISFCVCVCFMPTRCARVNVSFIFGSRFRCFVLHVCTHVHLQPHKHAYKKTCNGCPLVANVSLSDTREPPQCSLVWSCFVFPPVSIHKGLGLTFTSAHILVRALVDGPGSQPTDTMVHIKCVVRAPVAMVAVSLPHVCHRRETGLSP